MNEISPMFAVQAEQLLLAGMPEEAVELCLEGLEVYPGYAAAIAVLVKAYNILGDISSAENIVNDTKEYVLASSVRQIKEYVNHPINIDNSHSIVEQNFPFEIDDNIELDNGNDIIENYSVDSTVNEDQIIDNIRPDIDDSIETEPFSTKNYNDNINGNIPDYNFPVKLSASDISIIPGLNRFKPSTVPALFTSNKPVRKEKLLKIVKKQSDYLNIISSLNNAEVIKSEKSKKDDRRKSSVVVTETIAGILVQQGAFNEAKAAYLELSAKYPDKSNYFQSKIDAIDKRIG